MDLAVLKTELLAGHPDTGAYDADDAVAATELNVVNRTRTRATVEGSEILNATDDEEFTGLAAADKSRWLALCGVDEINTSSGVAKSLEADLFGENTTTRTNLVALKSPPASRAIELGLGVVTQGKVWEARR